MELRRIWLAATGLTLLLLLMRLPVLLHPAPIDDEVVYCVAGGELAAGGQVYRSAVERKPPLLLLVYGAIASLFGPYNAYALHLVGTVWILLTMAGMYSATRMLFDPRAGLVAASLYGLYQQWWYPSNLAFNGEVLMNMPIAWAYALAFGRRTGAARNVVLAFSGALCAVAALLKQPAMVAIGPLLCLPFLRARAAERPRAFGEAACLAGGFSAVLVFVGLWLAAEGLLVEAWYWTVLDHDVPHIFWHYAIEKTLHFAAVAFPIVAGAWISARDRALWKGRTAERMTLVIFAVLSAVGAAASGRFYPHYYIGLVLPLVLLSAPLVAQVLCENRLVLGRPVKRGLRFALVLTVAVFAAVQWRGMRLLPRDTAAGVYLRQNAAPVDRIFVWGRGTRIYVDAQRRPASRYISVFPLTGRIFGSPELRVDTRARIMPRAWAIFEREMRQHQPAYIVDAEATPEARYPIRDFPFLRDWVAKHYAVTAKTDGAVIYRRVRYAGRPRRKRRREWRTRALRFGGLLRRGAAE